MELSAHDIRTESEDRATAWTPTGGIMGVLVSGMGVGYLSKRWKRSSSNGSMGSDVRRVTLTKMWNNGNIKNTINKQFSD